MFSLTVGCEKQEKSESDGQLPDTSTANAIEKSKKAFSDREKRVPRDPFRPKARQSQSERDAEEQRLKNEHIASLLNKGDSSILRPNKKSLLPDLSGFEGKGVLASVDMNPLGTTETRAEREGVWRENYYKRLTFEKYYGQKIDPPPLDLEMDIHHFDLESLIHLRNEVFARHGYLFTNALIRDYFKQYKWYQPVFWEPDRVIELSPEEKAFVARVKEREEELIAKNEAEWSETTLGRIENVVNLGQFESIPDTMYKLLKNRNFVINWTEGRYQELHHVYDRNLYHCIPNFITTDLYLRLLNVHYKYLLMDLETSEMAPLLHHLVLGLYQEMLAFEANSPLDELLQDAVDYNLLVLGVAGNLLEEGSCAIPDRLQPDFDRIFSKAYSASGIGARELDANTLDFTQLKPRGNYTTRPELSRYFKAMRWLNSLPIHLDRIRSLQAAMLLARALDTNPELTVAYNYIENLTKLFAGNGDNLSLNQMRQMLEKHAKDADLSSYSDTKLLATIRAELIEMDPERIKPTSSSLEMQREMNRPKLLFTASRYMFDGEILQRLMSHERPLPMALDVFAVMHGGEAERTLLEGYREGHQWGEYASIVNQLRSELTGNIDWNESLYNKRMDLILSINQRDPRAPEFMQTRRWERKDIHTSIAAWTQLKHEMLLYTKQPIFAEAGEGGGPPPPIIPGYIEPNLSFWNKSLELLEATYLTLDMQGLMTTQRAANLQSCFRIGDFCRRISEKELAGEKVNDREMEVIMWLGARVEHAMYRIIPRDVVEEKLPIVVDVASHVGTKNECLEEAIGYADEIYVIAEINGRLYLTRGAVMSTYEFTQPISNRLTDETWRSILMRGRAPERPKWTKQLGDHLQAPKTKPFYGDHTDFLYLRGR